MFDFFPFIAHAVVTSSYFLHCLNQRANRKVPEMNAEFGIIVGYAMLTIHSLAVA